jgi:hypothetical protein
MATPLLLSFAPFAASFARWGSRAETLMVGGSCLLATASLCWGFRVHRRRRVLALLAASVLLIAASQLMAPGAEEIEVALAGSALLIAGQWLNHRLCAHCAHCDAHEPAKPDAPR